MNRNLKYLSSVATALSVVLGGANLAIAQDTVKFGILTGMSGDYGPWGQAGLAAAQIAADEINEAGGINGKKLELVVADNKSTLEGAVSGWKRLVEVEGVIAVGGMESDGALALLQESAISKVVIMCPACGTPKLKTLGGDYVFRLRGGDDDLGVILAQIALGKGKDAGAITQGGLDATESITGVFRKSFEKGGGQFLNDTHVSADTVSFRGDLDQAVNASPNLLVSTGLEVGIRLLSDYQRRNYQGTIYAIPEIISQEVAELGSGFFDGRIFGVSPTYDLESASYKSFAERYSKKTGKQPSPAMYEPNYYDQIILLALAATAGDVSGQGIRDNLVNVSGPEGEKVFSYADGVRELKAGKDIDYEGASGPIDFNEYGNVVSRYSEVTPRNGEWVNVSSVELNPDLR